MGSTGNLKRAGVYVVLKDVCCMLCMLSETAARSKTFLKRSGSG